MSIFEKEVYEYLADVDKERHVEERFLNDSDEMERFGVVINSIPENIQSLLDVGCGQGVFLHLLENHRSIKAFGLERAKDRIMIAVKMFQSDIIEGSADLLPFKDKSFDIVTALEVIEHLPFNTYEHALDEMERVAKNYIIISVPYNEKRIFIRCPYCHCEFNMSYHLRSFDDKKLKTIFNDFELLHLQGVTIKYNVPFVDKLVKLYRNLIDFFPTNTICPCCGYKKSFDSCGSGVIQSNSSSSRIYNTLKSIRQRFGPLFFTKKTYRWVVATYSRRQ